ncbi:HEXXH motif-containing putative peptide modification protein [Sphaerisporangium sp. NPDC088356]|uniref:aKG-HExxH-type peptide beta-hydroxylase n=1 Tax=Sphaerisporangium sp. NPDC088356 TaxID=3154871 RepID=UPI003440E56E
MYRRDSRERFLTLWRDDPRPIGGVVQGVYAFFGVTAFWRALTHHGKGNTKYRAEFEFGYWRAGTWHTLPRCRRLTLPRPHRPFNEPRRWGGPSHLPGDHGTIGQNAEFSTSCPSSRKGFVLCISGSLVRWMFHLIEWPYNSRTAASEPY